MDDEVKLAESLARAAMLVSPEESTYEQMRTRAVGRRRVMISLLSLTFIACGGGALLWFDWRSTTPDFETAATSDEVNSAPSMPDVVGTQEGDALKALSLLGVDSTIVYQVNAQEASGTVLGTDPAPGERIGASVPVLFVAAPAPHESESVAGDETLENLGRLIAEESDVFVGAYRNAHGELIVALGPDAQAAEWRDQIESLTDEPYATKSCPLSMHQLERVRLELADRAWDKGSLAAFSAWLDPPSCSILLQSDKLSEVDIVALAQMFGSAVTIDTSGGAYLYGSEGSQ